MQRPITTLNLPQYKIKELQNKGYVYCEDVNIATIRSDIGITSEEWKALTSSVVTKTAIDLIEDETICSNIVTFSSALDELLEGGVPIKMITEFCGLPGSGKTQICMQLCIAVQIPDCFGGVNGHAVYIDTNLGFSPSRLTDFAKGCLKYCTLLANNYNSFEMFEVLKGMTEESFLENTHYINITKFIELLALISALKLLLTKDPQIKLIIIDNITNPVKQTDLEYFERVKLIYSFLSDLQNLATEHKFAIVLTNDLTTKFDNSGHSYETPSLGDSFAHRINNRILLERQKDKLFKATFVKNVLKEHSEARFQILEDGIRDV